MENHQNKRAIFVGIGASFVILTITAAYLAYGAGRNVDDMQEEKEDKKQSQQ